MSTQPLPTKKSWDKRIEKELTCVCTLWLCHDGCLKWVFVWMNQVFLKEGTLMKLSRKVMQPRMFFLVSGHLCFCWVQGRELPNKGDTCSGQISLAHSNSSFSLTFGCIAYCLSSIENKVVWCIAFLTTAPMTYGRSGARDWIWATAAATSDPLTHCAGLGIEPIPLQRP